MSLDSALRQGLLAAGDAIAADTGQGMEGVVHRVKDRRKRQVVTGVAVAVILVALVVSSRDGGGFIDTIPELPPAREYNEPDVGQERTSQRSSSTVRVASTVVAPPSLARGQHEDAASASVGRDALSRTPRVRAPIVASAPDPRTVEESYKVGSAAGTHMGENAGLGCRDGAGFTGNDDCFHIEVGTDETSVLIEITDDAGIMVPFHINEHYEGESYDLGSFCSTTSERISVRPGSLLLVSVDGGSDCDDQTPTSGRLIAHFWQKAQ